MPIYAYRCTACGHEAQVWGPACAKCGAFDRAAWSQQFEALFLNQIDLTAHLAKGMAVRRWGRIVSIAGPVVDVEFPRGSLPEINTALEMTLTVAGEDVVIEPAEHLPA